MVAFRRECVKLGASVSAQPADRLQRLGGKGVRALLHGAKVDILRMDGSVQFSIDRSLLDAFRVQDVTPQPSTAALVDGGVEYRFQGSTSAPSAVVFEMQPAARWSVQGWIRSPGGAVRLRQFILP